MKAPEQAGFELKRDRIPRCPTIRQGINSLPHSESRLKTTEEFMSPLLEDFRYEAGVLTPAGLVEVSKI